MKHVFTSSYLTQGNTLFPITVTIDNNHMYYTKGFILGRTRLVIPKTSIASIGLIHKVFFSDLIVETKGGQTYYLNGFTHSDALKIYSLLKNNLVINR